MKTGVVIFRLYYKAIIKAIIYYLLIAIITLLSS